MKNIDSELIQRTLDGDQSAFTMIVEKYQKGVHALVWQKTGDFHIAQEITQDAFLRAYQKLETLKNHNLFSGWLYVIATRLCYEWCRKKRIPAQSLETLDTNEVDKVAYSQYIEEQRETDVDDARRELVRNLLKKLPESERTVMTLHYLGEMSCDSISKFLGISSNTVRSRLNRARNRLRKEEYMIHENLNSFQLPTQLTENIMKKISQLNPSPTTTSKPIVPYALSAVSAIFIFILMGVGTQNFYRYQQPYSLEAASESSIEIVDAQIVMDLSAKQSIRDQIGQSHVNGERIGTGQVPDAPLFASAHAEDNNVSNTQWVQTKGPEGGTVPILFASNQGDVYAGTQHGLYRLTDDGSAWKFVNTIKGPKHTSINNQLMWWPIAENKDTLYLANDTDILASSDRGETWNVIAKREEGRLAGIVITESLSQKQDEIGIILALTNGVFRSDDHGKTWTNLTDDFVKTEIKAITSVGKTIFAGTNKGLYCFKDDTWKKISLGEKEIQGKIINDIYTLSVSDNRMYVVTKIENVDKQKFDDVEVLDIENSNYAVFMGSPGDYWSMCSIYHSNDQGESWNAITPKLNTSGSKVRRQNPFSVT